MEIPVWFYVTTLFAAFAAGYGVGLKVATKSVIIDDSALCLQAGHKTKIKKIYTNGRCSDISCSALDADRVCRLTGDTCKYLT